MSKLKEKDETFYIESDPDGVDQHTPGAKSDKGKTEFFKFILTYFPNALRSVAEISAYGAKKYTPMGWRSVPSGVDRYTEALLRHLVAEAKGETIDPKTLLAHDAQVAWNALARLELRIRESIGG